MNVSQAAARVYAQALFDIGLSEGSVGQIYDDLHAVFDALNGLDADLMTFFYLPQFRRDDKRRILNLAFEGKIGRPVLGLLNILVEKRREPLLDNVVEEFDQYRRPARGPGPGPGRHGPQARRRPPRRAASPPSSSARRRTSSSHETVDPEVIGGLRVNIGDRVLDGTVRRRLHDMRRSFAATQR